MMIRKSAHLLVVLTCMLALVGCGKSAESEETAIAETAIAETETQSADEIGTGPEYDPDDYVEPTDEYTVSQMQSMGAKATLDGFPHDYDWARPFLSAISLDPSVGFGLDDAVILEGNIHQTLSDGVQFKAGHSTFFAVFNVDMHSEHKARTANLEDGAYVKVKAVYKGSEEIRNEYARSGETRMMHNFSCGIVVD